MIIFIIMSLPDLCVSLPGMIPYKIKSMACLTNHQNCNAYGATKPGSKSFNHKFYVGGIQIIALVITMNCANLPQDMPRILFHVPGKESKPNQKKVENYNLLFNDFEHNVN